MKKFFFSGSGTSTHRVALPARPLALSRAANRI
jgi:hypothetical protein